MAEAKTKWQYEVTGYDKEGRKVVHVLVEAVNSARSANPIQYAAMSANASRDSALLILRALLR